MKRKFTLYIGNRLADMDDDSFLLLNVRQDDLSNPTVVYNSFTQQITLRGTERNNAIFGHFYRTDRVTDGAGGGIGVGFDPSRKTPFKIYNEMAEIILAGYVKLDNVVRKLNRVEYKVTLYGGLGSFLYALHYSEDGNAKSLASLDYLGLGNPDGELDFTINAAAVDHAWNGGDLVQLEMVRQYNAVRLTVNGLISTNNNNYCQEFRIPKCCTTVYVTGRKTTTADQKVAVFYDDDYNVLGSFGSGTTVVYYTDEEVAVPDGTTIVRVATYSPAPIGLKIPNPVWCVLSFAPAYNGIPENFSADKAIGVPSDFGLANTQGSFGLNAGKALFNLTANMDEWAMKDIRSYLQRPVLSMRAFLDAVCNPDNNGGYEVDYSDIAGSDYVDTWLTLPMLPSLTPQKSGSGVSLGTIGSTDGKISIVGTVPAGSTVTATISYVVRAYLNYSAVDGYTFLYSGAYNNDAKPKGRQTAFFVQVVAYNSSNVAVGGSTIRSWYDFDVAPDVMAGYCGYIPTVDAEFEEEVNGIQTWQNLGSRVLSGLQGSGEVSGLNVAYFKVEVAEFNVTTVTEGGVTELDNINGLTGPRLYANYSTYWTGVYRYAAGTGGQSVSISSASSFIRSGALITKAMLLSTSKTPADYLLSFCKTFGLYMLCDEAEKKVTILGRNSLYQNAGMDLQGRVDIGKGIDITPLAFDAKWYDFDPEVAEGAFAKEYRDVYGIPYGIQRVNTGYDFNAAATNLIDGTVLRAAACILRYSKYYNIIQDAGTFVPSPWIDKGNTYTLWDASGNTAEYPISCPPSGATITYLNPTYPGYDVLGAQKPEFAAIDNKAVDGTDVLLFQDGVANYPYFQLTDDSPEMDTLNEGPCWIIGGGNSLGIDLPVFTRYKMNGQTVERSLDFGKPKEIAIPGVTYPDNTTIYRKCWSAYLADKYNRDTKVLKCRVNLNDQQIKRALLRQFYAFGGSLFVLNAIVNHSMTTYDLTECEFVQVQDKDAYLTGQNL